MAYKRLIVRVSMEDDNYKDVVTTQRMLDIKNELADYRGPHNEIVKQHVDEMLYQLERAGLFS